MSKSFKIVAAQGECNLRRISEIPTDIKNALIPVKSEKGFLVVAHSESGNSHGFRDDGNVTIMERTKDVPAGMKILYAIVQNPSELIQDAAMPHEGIAVEPGIYEMRISREYNPFLEEARRVAD